MEEATYLVLFLILHDSQFCLPFILFCQNLYKKKTKLKTKIFQNILNLRLFCFLFKDFGFYLSMIQ